MTTAKNIRCAFIGGFGISRGPLRALAGWCYGGGHSLVGVVGQPQKSNGGWNYEKLNPAAKTAQQLHLPVYVTRSLKRVEQGGQEIAEQDRRTYDMLSQDDLQLVVVAGSGLMIPPGLLQKRNTMFINMHPSILPHYRGPAAIPRAISLGETSVGITIHQIDEQIDHGPILAQEHVPINSTDDAAIATLKATEQGTTLLLQVLNDYLGGRLRPIPQPHEDPDHKMGDAIRDEERHLRWYDWRAQEAFNRIRGFKAPGQGCFVRFEKGGIKTDLQIRDASLVPAGAEDFDLRRNPPGTITAIDGLVGFTVVAKDQRPVLIRRFVDLKKADGKDKRPLMQIMMELNMAVGDRLT